MFLVLYGVAVKIVPFQIINVPPFWKKEFTIKKNVHRNSLLRLSSECVCIFGFQQTIQKLAILCPLAHLSFRFFFGANDGCVRSFKFQLKIQIFHFVFSIFLTGNYSFRFRIQVHFFFQNMSIFLDIKH